ncbi:DUF4167 domain-containing protein [Candidatus Puniceispirillum marinum]|uniref:DUF4167 domain-containing protein n=1 Tax=Puniceispirillum marinum (strain IMCC1322) TaxID=488538 RepID=D5BMY3_PUNMI|nr:DUF4167 domain-containing protein [Candidatus Puniceispirillum marinum]ADE40176.1 hypothetical protein SAR116_1933 [Candidatus Puniceispirillum marinum IMCC1322]
MRQPQNAKRGRGRGRRGNGGGGGSHVPNRNTSYESNGPDVKLRGNAQQLHEKYIALAHDASSSGERIAAEAYSQFADHYFRLHQAAVGAAETKRQQEQAAQVANGEAAETKPEAVNGDADKASPADSSAPESDEAEGAKKSSTSQRKPRVKPAETDDTSALSPAQLAEAVQDEQDNKKVAS